MKISLNSTLGTNYIMDVHSRLIMSFDLGDGISNATRRLLDARNEVKGDLAFRLLFCLMATKVCLCLAGIIYGSWNKVLKMAQKQGYVLKGTR